MMEELSKLYSPFIKAQNETPFHFEKKTDAEITLKAYNPVCGDRYELFIAGEIYFHGFGCAISKASTSFLATVLSGKQRQSVREVMLGLPSEPTFPSKIKRNPPKEP